MWIRCVRAARRAWGWAPSLTHGVGSGALTAALGGAVLPWLQPEAAGVVALHLGLGPRGGWIAGGGLLVAGLCLASLGVGAAAAAIVRLRGGSSRFGMAAASVLLVGLQVPWGALAGVGHTLSRARTPRLAQLERLLPAGAYEVRVSGPPITHVGPVGWPVPGRTRVTSGFGWRRHPILGGARFHNGIDIAMAEGTPVRAAAPGTVHRAGEDPLNGRYVVLLHGRGLRTAYCHLSAVQAERGAPVQAGEVIGRSGQTGRASGPHLHFGTWVRGRAVDPLRLVASTP